MIIGLGSQRLSNPMTPSPFGRIMYRNEMKCNYSISVFLRLSQFINIYIYPGATSRSLPDELSVSEMKLNGRVGICSSCLNFDVYLREIFFMTMYIF